MLVCESVVNESLVTRKVLASFMVLKELSFADALGEF